MLKRPIQALAIALGIAVAADAYACSFHVTSIGGFDVAYPGSLGVAVAVAEARAAGELPQIDVSRSAFGYLIVSKRLKALGEEFAEEFQGDGTSFSLVLASSRLWTAFDGSGDALRTRVHEDGPLEGKPVIVTEFLVVDAIMQGQMTVAEARDAGLLVIRDDRDGRVADLVDRALETV